MRIATAAPAADDGDDDEPRRRNNPTPNRDAAARDLLLRMGKARFGKPPPDVLARLQKLTVEEMEPLTVSIFTATSWVEWLNPEQP